MPRSLRHVRTSFSGSSALAGGGPGDTLHESAGGRRIRYLRGDGVVKPTAGRPHVTCANAGSVSPAPEAVAMTGSSGGVMPSAPRSTNTGLVNAKVRVAGRATDGG